MVDALAMNAARVRATVIVGARTEIGVGVMRRVGVGVGAMRRVGVGVMRRVGVGLSLGSLGVHEAVLVRATRVHRVEAALVQEHEEHCHR